MSANITAKARSLLTLPTLVSFLLLLTACASTPKAAELEGPRIKKRTV